MTGIREELMKKLRQAQDKVVFINGGEKF